MERWKRRWERAASSEILERTTEEAAGFAGTTCPKEMFVIEREEWR